jgi:ArsR family transcriptional regulator
VLADPNRVRLLALLEREELTVAELAAVTLLAQPRVSTHLAKLREASLVKDRKSGVQAYYRFNDSVEPHTARSLWAAVRKTIDDSLLQADAERLPAILAARARTRNWADSVAGDMERHYSPGRTWEATARAMLQLLELGDVLDVASGDGALAELLAHRAESVTCVDLSDKVVKAGRKRLKQLGNVSFHQADMHALPFDDASFDVALLMHALTYTSQPQLAITELGRVLRPGGVLVATTLNRHQHERSVEPYDHKNLGFKPAELKSMCEQSGFLVNACGVTSREGRAPNFEIITLHATRDKAQGK